MAYFTSRPAAFAVAFIVLLSSGLYAQKADVADILAKHRASVGTPEALATVKNQLVLTNAQFVLKGSAALITGKAVILSAPGKSLWGMNFASNDYPQDRFGYDGKDVRVAKMTPTNWSLLGEFLNNNRGIIREGLLGGTLSAAWPLLQADLRNAKVRYEGTKKVGDLDTIVLSYAPKGGSDLTTKIYLDAKTYQHVRTEYTLVRAAIQGNTPDQSAGQSGSIYRLVEDFSNFTKIGQLTVPGRAKITYSRTGTADSAPLQKANRDAEWTFVVTNMGINRDLDANSFDVEGK